MEQYAGVGVQLKIMFFNFQAPCLKTVNAKRLCIIHMYIYIGKLLQENKKIYYSCNVILHPLATRTQSGAECAAIFRSLPLLKNKPSNAPRQMSLTTSAMDHCYSCYIYIL